jgi:hypothetical protein
MVIEHKGKRYSVVGEGDSYYICTECLDEIEGETFRIPKAKEKVDKNETNKL